METSTTREKLYEEIWNEPISRVCKNYNVSDNSLRKKCLALNIPMPDNAYWTNFRLGKLVNKKPLPAYNGNSNIVFQCKNDSENLTAVIKEDGLFYYFNENERKLINKVYENLAVKKRLDQPHKLIEEHKAYWIDCIKNKIDLDHIFKGLFDKIPYDAKLDKNKMIIDTYSVSKEQIHRAYLIYDCLINAFEQCGFVVKVNSNSSTVVTIRGEDIELRMREKYEKVEIDDKKYSWRTYEYNPKGELVFMFKSSIDYNYCEIYDGKSELVEDKIKTIFKKICDKVESVKIENRIREERNKQYEIERQKQEVIRKIHADEKLKVIEFLKKVKQFELAEKIRNFACCLRNKSEEEKELYKWAMEKADWFDPNLNTADKILTEKDKDDLASIDEKDVTRNYYNY